MATTKEISTVFRVLNNYYAEELARLKQENKEREKEAQQ